MFKKQLKKILVVLSILIIVTIIIAQSGIFFSDLKVDSLKEELKNSIKEDQKIYISDKYINSLPLPVQRYAKFALNGKRVFKNHAIRWDEEGVFQLPKLGRLNMRASQLSKVDQPYYLWRGYMSKLNGLLKIETIDLFAVNRHNMRGKIWGLITVMQSNYTEKEDINSLHSYLLLRYYGTALNFPWVLFSDPNLSWEEIDEYHAYLMVKNRYTKVKYLVSFSEDGKIEKMQTPKYYLHGNYENLKEIAQKSKYVNYKGLMVPTHMKYTWLDKYNNKTVYEFDIKKIREIK